MKRSDAIDLLEAYNKFLMEEGYADADLYCEKPTSIDGFLLSEWGKEHLPLEVNITTVGEIDPDAVPQYPFCANKERCGYWVGNRLYPTYKCYTTGRCPAYIRNRKKR